MNKADKVGVLFVAACLCFSFGLFVAIVLSSML